MNEQAMSKAVDLLLRRRNVREKVHAMKTHEEPTMTNKLDEKIDELKTIRRIIHAMKPLGPHGIARTLDYLSSYFTNELRQSHDTGTTHDRGHRASTENIHLGSE